MDIREFADKTARVATVVSSVPEINKIYRSWSVVEREHTRVIIDKIEKYDREIDFKISRTVRLVFMRASRNVVEVELPGKSVLRIVPAEEYLDYIYAVENKKTLELPLSVIAKYLEPKDELAEQVLNEIKNIECKTCYIEEVEPFRPSIYDKKEQTVIKSTKILNEVDKFIKQYSPGKIDIVYEELFYPVIVKPYYGYGEEVKYYNNAYVGVVEYYTGTVIAISSDMSVAAMERIYDMHDTLVRGVVRIVERFT